MQNQFLPEETPQYQPPAPIVQEAESTTETETTTANTLTASEVQTRLLDMKRAARRRVYGFILKCLAVVLLPIIAMQALSSPGKPVALSVTILGMLLTMTWLLSEMIRFKRAKPLHEYAQIAREGGATAVGPLLEMRRDNLTPANGRAIDAALALCLPQMRTQDAGQLDAAQHRLLLSFLRIPPIGERPDAAQTDFRVAALQALAQIGEASDLPLVEGLAGMDAKTKDLARIRDAAQECLPLLKIRLGLIADAKTLLRASMPEKETSAILLRPATGPNDAKPNELLRPSDKPTP